MRKAYLFSLRLTFFLFFIFTSYVRAQEANIKPIKGLKIFSDTKTFSSVIPGHLIVSELGIGNKNSFSATSSNSDNLGFEHQKFQQFYNGVKVEFGETILHSKSRGIVSMSYNVYDLENFTTTPTISALVAFNTALSHVNATTYLWEKAEEAKLIDDYKKPSGELVILPQLKGETIELALAYKFDIYATNPVSRADIYIDAINGNVLFENKTIHTADEHASGASLYNGDVNFTADNNGGQYRLNQTTSGDGVNTYTLNRSTNYSNAVEITSDSNVFSADSSTGVQAHWGSEHTYNYFDQKHNRNSYDDLGTALTSYVSYSSNYVNAFWNGSFMTYGDGDGYSRGPLVSLDIVGHEIAHGVTQNSSNLVYSYESGALNESFSDIFGEAIENFAKGSNDWLMGHDIGLSGNSGAFRSMANPNQFSNPDTYLGDFWYWGSGDNGGVHFNSGVQNKWFYILVNGEAGVNDNGDSYTVNAIGMDKASAVAYRNLTVYLSRYSQYSDARLGAIQSAVDLYGADSAEVIAVTNAWYAVGVGEEFIICPDALENEDTSVSLELGVLVGGIDAVTATNTDTNNSDCAIEVSNTDVGEPWGRYRIEINLAQNDIQAGDALIIGIDGKNTTGLGRIEVTQDNTPNSSLLDKTFNSTWSRIEETITVPAGIETLDIWLFSNYGQTEGGTAIYDNLVVKKQGVEERPFVTTWKTDNPGTSTDNQITIPTFTGETYNYTVDWGDGSSDTGVTGDITHTYATAGTYEVSISGEFPRIYFNNSGDNEKKIVFINQWGDIVWSNFTNAFRGCTELDVVASDTPDMSNVFRVADMFNSCKKLIGNDSFGNWDVSNILNASSMFWGCELFNQDIGNWDISSMIRLDYFFSGAKIFNQDIGDWDLRNVEIMFQMFNDATAFNQDISNWNFPKVTSLSALFQNAESFNQDISAWDVSKVEDFGALFSLAKSFNQPIGTWDMSAAKNTALMFQGADSFNSDIRNWNVSNLENMAGMFSYNPIFNQDISGWNVGKVTSMGGVFWNNSVFNQDLSNWDTSNVFDMGRIFYGAVSFNQNLGNWNVSNVQNMSDMFLGAGLSVSSYDNTLIGWSELPSLQSGVQLDAETLKYCLGEEARQKLIDDYGWVITDDGKSADCNAIVCSDTIENEDASVSIELGVLVGGIDSVTGTNIDTNNSDCAIEVSNTDVGEPWGRYLIEINLAQNNIQAGDELTIGIDGKNTTGVARIEVNQDNAPNSSLLDKTFNSTWSRIEETITVPAGIETLDIWLFSNYGQTEGGTAIYDNLVVKKQGVEERPFVTTWKTDNPGTSTDNQITIPTFSEETYNYTVDWGDGSSDTGVTGDITHTYATAGTYEVSISGEFPRIFFNNSGDNEKIVFVNQWGNNQWVSMAFAFSGCFNMDIIAIDVPNLSEVTTMQNMLSNCYSLLGNVSLSQWNVSNVNYMSALFFQNDLFNQDIGDWDVSNLIDASGMFFGAKSFNQDISGWNISKLQYMGGMFNGATVFNQDIGNWDVSNVNNFNNTFARTNFFNQDLSNWNVSKVLVLSGMFSEAVAFNQDLSNWDVTRVVDMQSMFEGAISFNQNIGSWDISNVKSMEAMFLNSGLSVNNYDKTLIGWSELPSLQDNVVFGVDNSQYCQGEEARQKIIDNYGWVITDGGKSADCNAIVCSDTIENEDASVSIELGVLVGGIDSVTGTNIDTKNSDCAIEVSNTDVGEPWGRYRIEINLAQNDIQAGDALIIGIDGKNTTGLGRIEVTQDNTPNSSLLDKTFDSNWSRLEETITVPAGIETLDIWLFSNYGQTEGGTTIYDNLVVKKQGVEERPFVTTWKTDNLGTSADNQITIPTFPGETYNYAVDWGDGSSDTGVTGDITHTYATAGTYEVSISGEFPRIYFNKNVDNYKLLEINQWGDNEWSSMEGAFYNTDLNILAVDKPNLSKVTSLKLMFSQSSSLTNDNESLNTWDVSNISDISGAFSYADNFNINIGSWDVGNVMNMDNLFAGAVSFNQDISNWDVSNVTSMNSVFSGAESFNQNLNTWNVSNVVGMQYLFSGAKSFNQDVSSWNVSSVQYMVGVFQRATSFNQDIGNWDVVNVINMSSLFSGATSFNQDLSDWDVSNVQSMYYTFNDATNFNQPIGSWNISSVTNMESMFKLAINFNQNIGDWDVSGVIVMEDMMQETNLSKENYDKLLTSWSELPSLQDNIAFGVGNSQYCQGEEARQKIIDDYGWVITDGGKSEDCSAVICSNELLNEEDGIVLTAGNSSRVLSILGTSTDTNSSDCALEVINDTDNEQWARHHIVIDLASNNLQAGDELLIGIDGKSVTGKARVEVNQNNKVNTNLLTKTFDSSWSRVEEIITIPSTAGLETLDIWLFSNYAVLIKGTALYDNLVVKKQGAEERPFITTWKTDNPGTSADNQITIPTRSNMQYNYTVDWGDGSSDSGVTGNITHTYETVGTYEVSISGEFPQMFFNDEDYAAENSDSEKILFIEQWGDIQWENMSVAFKGCENLDVLATDTPNLSEVNSLYEMFFGCANLIGNSSFGNWDVSRINNMTGVFQNAFNFNQPIGTWNVANVVDMSNMFWNNQVFNQDIGNWNTQNVKKMENTFLGATSFNQDISNWNTSEVYTMRGLFRLATSFNQNLNTWDVSNVNDMSSMFFEATTFNQDITNWNTGKVENMIGMFRLATSFNQDISDWNTSSLTRSAVMFEGAVSFNQNLGGWNVSNVNNLSRMFLGAGLSVDNYDSTLNGWSQLPLLQNGVIFDAGTSQYCLGEEARQKLIDDYGWIITDGGKSIDCSTPIIATPLKVSLNELMISPNPANEEVKMKFELPIDVYSLRVYDILGRLVRTINTSESKSQDGYQVNVQELPAGTYFVKSTDTKGISLSKQMVIKR
ncbi:BspA family leucine-rich repeat surface protein [uncultured Maribacter sp.]|uniref:BspA family leucine-rich repeat surface protein n=1 Tax=uncultured Maribacter sp. TaxID=431308 RepID=UPI002624F9DD|nr:BspA family leucine-rich repeat surface protein [uncultured Maribacter sp.]